MIKETRCTHFLLIVIRLATSVSTRANTIEDRPYDPMAEDTISDALLYAKLAASYAGVLPSDPSP